MTMHQNDAMLFSRKNHHQTGKSPVTRQESAALNMAKFIRAQTLLLLERLEQMDLDEAAGCCEHLRSGRSALRHAERTDRRGKCVKIGERVRNSVRGREAMAGVGAQP